MGGRTEARPERAVSVWGVTADGSVSGGYGSVKDH
jgi:hypothetical protein